MQLKNKKQREEFLNNYKSWKLWKEIPEIEVKLYRFLFPNGTAVIATEYACKKLADYAPGAPLEYKKTTDVKYHLLLAEGETYKTNFYVINEHRFYNPSGDSKSAIVQYLTEVKPEV